MPARAAPTAPTPTNFTAYQSAIWDLTNNPQVLSSSFSFNSQVAPGSPFYKATQGLWTDVALRNISLFSDMGDRGSGNSFGNGLTNGNTSRDSAFVVMVGGTSLSTVGAAGADATLADVTQKAMAGDLATLWKLAAGGLSAMPGTASAGTAFVETIWNRYYLNGDTFGVPGSSNPSGYLKNNTSGGGADPGQPIPQYQQDYGLRPVTNDPYHLPGRGNPDVSANAGGNMFWLVPGADMTGVQGDDGTSASTPFWAGLTAQLNAVFHDQKLPQLGYMNDLLYIASAIAPAVFNDITMGTNASSFVLGGSIMSDSVKSRRPATATAAAAGYDLASGLGTPNAMLLARELTHIAHHQMSFDHIPSLIEGSGARGWTSGADQTFLIQATTVAPMRASLTLGDHTINFDDTVAATYAWTSRFAEQVMQDNFDPNLVRLFDKQAMGWVGSWDVAAGTSVSALIGQGLGMANQANLTSPFGIADFATRPFSTTENGVTTTLTGGDIHLARAVAVAETADRTDGQDAIVRVRQNGQDQLAVSFYKVDDFSGKIGNLNPGDAGYAEASAAHAYGRSRRLAAAGPGLRLLRADGDHQHQCRRHDRHDPDQPLDRRRVLRLRPRQQRRPRAHRQLRPQHLGLGGHARRRRPRLQRPGRAARLHQQQRARVAGVGICPASPPQEGFAGQAGRAMSRMWDDAIDDRGQTQRKERRLVTPLASRRPRPRRHRVQAPPPAGAARDLRHAAAARLSPQCLLRSLQGRAVHQPGRTAGPCRRAGGQRRFPMPAVRQLGHYRLTPPFRGEKPPCSSRRAPAAAPPTMTRRRSSAPSPC